MYKVIVQVKDEERVPQAIKSVINLYNDLKDVQIEVVFHQSAIRALVKGNPNEDYVEKMITSGINVVGCMNSINALNLKVESLIKGISIVTAGVGEIVRKQAEGWIYLSL
ncbi:DsrE family protein [Acidianus sp. HS-5]|uniref:DsrE family protein n=1 Tax=Acidianus sp. HS-5 TaxID=2886040 RepID=UPI001F1C947A|nr:DsrE family protein [Acidianus sp. HS-5]BDC18049.1 sulfur reductase DrsE [Acidianus sp. HS-5]